MVALTGRAPAALLAVAVLGSGGCLSFLRPDGPRTVPAGQRELLVAPSVYLGERQDGNAFNVDVMYRVGIADRVDLGGRVNASSATADLKMMLWQSASPASGVDLAVAPSVGYGTDISWNGNNSRSTAALLAGLPVLIGINLGAQKILVTPQVLYQRVSVLPDGVLNLGGTVAFMTTDARFQIIPAIAIWKALEPRRIGESLRGPGPVMFQPSVIFRWGP
jgi:hypothetical protein